MNIYTVRRLFGLANYLKNVKDAAPRSSEAYDSRHMSPEFAMEAARIRSQRYSLIPSTNSPDSRTLWHPRPLPA